MTPLEKLKADASLIEEKLGYVFQNKDLLFNALIHRSYINEHRGEGVTHNERLEFLGDSILNLIAADYLYHRLPTHTEGQLSQLRSKLVDAAACAKYLQKLELSDYLLLGRGEKITEGKSKLSIQSDAFEAVVGAIYLDGGLPIAKSFFLCHFEKEADEALGSPPRNYKAELQDFTQKKYQCTPVYKVAKESGPDHAKQFHVLVLIQNKEAGFGIGNTKKEAEQRAAFEALSKL